MIFYKKLSIFVLHTNHFSRFKQFEIVDTNFKKNLIFQSKNIFNLIIINLIKKFKKKNNKLQESLKETTSNIQFHHPS